LAKLNISHTLNLKRSLSRRKQTYSYNFWHHQIVT
jgi:hypothetical protein